MTAFPTAGPAAALIELRGIGRDFGTAQAPSTVLDGIDLRIEAGEYVAIVGPSGSGKSTLMNILGGLDRPSRGQYLHEGRDVSRCSADELAALRRHSFGFVFQRYNLLAGDSALANVEVPALYAGVDAGERRRRAAALLDRLGLAGRSGHRPDQLSGGQQQRVSIARALMNGAQVILADEPTGALDRESGRQVMALLRELHEAGHTLVLITHDEAVARQAGRRIRIEDGRIVEDQRLAGPAAAPAAPVAATPPPPSARSSWRHDLGEALRLAQRALRSHLLRTALTLLGVVIGVASVVAMLALGDGSKAQVLERIEAMGADLLVVRPGARNVRTREESASLLPEDAAAIAELPGVRLAVPEYGQAQQIRAGSVDVTTQVNGTGVDYAQARGWRLAAGTFHSAADERGAAAVLVLGHTVAQQLFEDGSDPVGQTVLVRNVPFLVIGVLAPKGASASGNDQDDVALMPLSTARLRLYGRAHLRAITVQVQDVARADAVADTVRALLRERHGKDDFQVRNMASLLETASQTQDTLTLLLGSVAAISLLVGGIGVMNIMWVSVTERVREIGIRMACGARMRHILMQFNLEALLVCSAGGLIGVALGLAAAALAEQAGAPVRFAGLPIVLALGTSLGIGLLFGYLPARRAARLDPVQALATQ
ncbi:MacB family efflux pump subunit [Sphaerotilus mobilis]|uniref:Macrolide transport system ATP-binding/permease protein n=1 Tax=Sphaerotilus mobilis TaxID=47994 RepID=A0A4Q7LRI1_9BURK|nr:MacB family efflux pump subunit [Sphaerotilus mobilis]RZS56832.1 macrolide transport system ATP-binding/permease protein [Sphaerotilus mobilis]